MIGFQSRMSVIQNALQLGNAHLIALGVVAANASKAGAVRRQ